MAPAEKTSVDAALLTEVDSKEGQRAALKTFLSTQHVLLSWLPLPCQSLAASHRVVTYHHRWAGTNRHEIWLICLNVIGRWFTFQILPILYKLFLQAFYQMDVLDKSKGLRQHSIWRARTGCNWIFNFTLALWQKCCDTVVDISWVGRTGPPVKTCISHPSAVKQSRGRWELQFPSAHACSSFFALYATPILIFCSLYKRVKNKYRSISSGVTVSRKSWVRNFVAVQRLRRVSQEIRK